jgi:hypothetical protein
MEKIKKGYKTPFFKNSCQGQPTQSEPRMIESLGERPIYQPKKYWGCEGDHLYRVSLRKENYYSYESINPSLLLLQRQNLQILSRCKEVGISFPDYKI